MALTTTQTIFYGLIAYYIGSKIWNMLFGKKTDDDTDDLVESGLVPEKKKMFFGLVTPKQRFPHKVTDMDAKAFGYPYFYNEVDHTKGRFVHWFRKKIDEADERKVGLYRAKIMTDHIFLWFFKTSRELVTPCVFRPGIDAIQKLPGEEPGVPPEGMVIFKRSMDGKRVSEEASYNRWRARVLLERHQKKMLDDMVTTLLSKDHLEASSLVNKETTDQIENILKRLNKIRSAAGSGGAGEMGLGGGFGQPYGDEIYGTEEQTPAGGSVWNLEGGT